MKKNLLILSAAAMLALASCGMQAGSSSSSSSPSGEAASSAASSSQAGSSVEEKSSEPASSSVSDPSASSANTEEASSSIEEASSEPISSQEGSSIEEIVSSNEESSEEEQSSFEDESSSEEESESEPPFDPYADLSAALSGAKDNMRSTVSAISVASESEYYWQTSYVDGYEVVYDAYIAEIGFGNAAYRFFHDYDGKNWNYFEGDEAKGERSGWLCYNEAANADLTLASNYGDERVLLDMLSESIDSIDYYEGFFFLDDQDVIADIIDIAYPNLAYVPNVTESYWYDSTSVNVIAIALNQNADLSGILLYDEDIDTEANSVLINFDGIGTTSLSSAVPSSVTIPEAPNAENTLAFWQYKGLTGPYIEVYPASIAIAAKDQAGVSSFELEIEDTLALSRDVTYDAVEEGVEEARILRRSSSLEWESDDESVATVDYSGNITAVAAGEAHIAATALDKDGNEVVSNVITVTVKPLAEQNLEGAVYNFDFGYVNEDYDEAGFASVKATNKLDGDLPYAIRANRGVSILRSDDDSIFGGAKTMIIRLGDQSTMHDPEFAGDGVVSFDFDDQQVSGVSFYYGGFYSNFRQDADFLQSVRIETSNDGEVWTTAADITEEVLANASDENLKLMEKSFAPASKVRLIVESKNMIGVTFSIALPSIAFIANDECHAHVDSGSNPITAISIKAKGDVDSIRVNKTLQFLPTITPADASNPDLIWCVDDDTVASIDGDGLLTALSEGTVNVYATDNTGTVVSNYVAITVTPLPTISSSYDGTWKGEDLEGNPITLVIDGTSMTATSGSYEASLSYVDYDDDSRSFVFASTNDTIKVYYSEFEHALSVRGTFNGVEIKMGNGNAKTFDKFLPATAIALSSVNSSVLGGNSFVITASFTPSDATDRDLDWSCDHPELVNIVETSSGAYVYTQAVSEDTVIIITATSENGVVGTISITLTAPKKVTSISVSLAASSIEVGHKTQATATVTPDDADNASVTWSSSNPEVAIVDKNGVVTAVSEGEANIIATAKDGSGVVGSATITVTAPTGESIDGTYSGETDFGYSEFTITISNNGTIATLVVTDADEEGEFELDETLSSGNVYVFVGTFAWAYPNTVLTIDFDSMTASLVAEDGETFIVYYACDTIDGASISK